MGDLEESGVFLSAAMVSSQKLCVFEKIYQLVYYFFKFELCHHVFSWNMAIEKCCLQKTTEK